MGWVCSTTIMIRLRTRRSCTGAPTTAPRRKPGSIATGRPRSEPHGWVSDIEDVYTPRSETMKTFPWAALVVMLAPLTVWEISEPNAPAVKAAPTAQANPGPPKLAGELSRLGAAETMTSATFQIVDWNGDGLPDIVQMSAGGDRAWVILNHGTRNAQRFEFPQRLPTVFSETEPHLFPTVEDI